MSDKTTILLAEDEPALGQIIKESLETRMFKVLLCNNGEIAFETYKKELSGYLWNTRGGKRTANASLPCRFANSTKSPRTS